MARGYTPEELEIAIKAAVKAGGSEHVIRKDAATGAPALPALKSALYAIGVEELTPAKESFYVNIYNEHQVGPFRDRNEADDAAIMGRVACIRVEYSEGQFDD